MGYTHQKHEFLVSRGVLQTARSLLPLSSFTLLAEIHGFSKGLTSLGFSQSSHLCKIYKKEERKCALRRRCPPTYLCGSVGSLPQTSFPSVMIFHFQLFLQAKDPFLFFFVPDETTKNSWKTWKCSVKLPEESVLQVHFIKHRKLSVVFIMR